MNPASAKAVVAILVAAFPGAGITPATIATYGRLMVDIDEGTMAEATALIALRCRKFPSIGEIREAVDEVRGTSPPDVDVAWTEVYSAAKRGRQPSKWSHPAVAALGFDEVRMSETIGVERAHFTRLYETARKRLVDSNRRQLAAESRSEILDLMENVVRKHDALPRGEAAPVMRQLADRVKRGGQ